MPHPDSTVMGAQTQDSGITEAQVYTAIADVLDPELDEPLVKLGFIDHVQVQGADVTVSFKLPTYWCSPNFAYLMASDLRQAIRALPGVGSVQVRLLDHCAEEEVTSGVNRGQSFAEAFAGEVTEDADLEDLRRIFLRKGFLMRQEGLLRQLLKAGLDEASILSLRVADLIVDEGEDLAWVRTATGTVTLERMGQKAAAYLRKGERLGVLHTPEDRLIIDDQGQPVPADGLQAFLRRSRSVRLNIMFNTSMCKGLFRTRYEGADSSQAHRDHEGEFV